MAAPLSGVGQQQVPISQPVPNTADQSRQIRQVEQQPREQELQVRGAAAAQAQNASNAEEEITAFQRRQEDIQQNASQSDNDTQPAPRRGSVIDLVV